MTWRLLARGGAVIAVAAGGSGQRSLVVAVATRAVQCGSGGVAVGVRCVSRGLRPLRPGAGARGPTDPATHGARGRSLARSLPRSGTTGE